MDEQIADKIRTASENAMRHVLERRDEYVKAWIAETGVLPTDACLVEQVGPNGVNVVVAMRHVAAQAMGPTQCIDPVQKARTLLGALSNTEFLDAIDGRCLACGTKHSPCYCQRDE